MFVNLIPTKGQAGETDFVEMRYSGKRMPTQVFLLFFYCKFIRTFQFRSKYSLEICVRPEKL